MTENNTEKKNRAVLVGLSSRALAPEENADEASMEELSALLETAGGECVGVVTQSKDSPDPRTFIGEGKVAEVKELAHAMDADMVIFDNGLSPSQQRVLSEDLGVSVLDRSALILDIFAQRARTREGRLQVELAQYKYLLPRLMGMWTHLERQEGAIGTRGPGETQLESDRRHIRRKISKLEEELKDVRRVRATQRERRIKNEVPVVAIVGYTNAGKSTLLNRLTGAAIPANDRLFDTLDTTTRTLEISDTCTVLISDTVGFIRKLPHHLVEAFKATLEELEYADLLLHVIDAGGGGGPDPGAGGRTDPPPGCFQQMRPVSGGHPAPRGGHRLHLRQDRRGGARTAGRHRQAAGQRRPPGDHPSALRPGRAAGQALPAGQGGVGGVRRDHRCGGGLHPQGDRSAGPAGGGLEAPSGALGRLKAPSQKRKGKDHGRDAQTLAPGGRPLYRPACR